MATKVNSKGTAARAGARGTAAGMRAGAKSRTEAREMTSETGKKTQKELTKRGGPGRAGAKDKGATAAAKRLAKPTKRTAARGRGERASAGA
jgi:hypothetical protein